MIERVEPYTQQAIIAAALRAWLKDGGYL